MKTLLSAIATSALVATFVMPVQAAEKLDTNSETAKYSYAQGFLIGQRFKKQLIGDKTDLDAFAQGMRDSLT
ncbi:MAG TPA: hypothetical protein ENJ55_07980, partial [Rhizobiales bacterium]|nr:hypothetical protein [Hyphomicrobiales bacterium]